MNLDNYQPFRSSDPFDNEQDSVLFYKRIYSLYKYMQKQIGENETVVPTVHLYDGSTINVDFFGVYQPNMITILGKNSSGNEVFLILHLNTVQINFTIKKIEDNKDKHHLGFRILSSNSDK